MKKKLTVTKLFLWLLTGIVFTYAVVAMMLSGHINFNCFYDVGEIYDVYKASPIAGTTNISYNEKNQMCVIQNEEASMRILINDKKTLWKYLRLDVSLYQKKQLQVQLQCVDQLGVVVYKHDFSLQNGSNYIPMNQNNISSILLCFQNQQNQQYLFSKIRLYENEPVFSIKKVCLYGGIVFAIYILLSLVSTHLYIHKKSWDWYAPIDGLQSIYCKISEYLTGLYRLSGQVRNQIRTSVFSGIIIFMYLMRISGNYQRASKWYVLVGTICILCMTMVSIESPLKKRNWKNPLVASWFILWSWTLISDFIVQKRIAFIGIAMIMVFPFLFLAWNNMKQPKELLKNIMDAIEGTFWLNILGCFLFRPYTEGIRYTGTEKNPGYFAMYMVVACVVFVVKWEDEYLNQRLNGRVLRYIAGITMSLLMVWNTQSITSILAIAVLVGFYFIRLLILKIKNPQVKVTRKYIFTICCMVMICGVFQYGLKNISPTLHWQKYYENEAKIATHQINLFSHKVYAAQLDQSMSNRIKNKLLDVHNMDKLTSGRNLYWLEYLREFNLFGHSSRPYFWGADHQAHNMILAIVQQYGIIIVIPYIMLLLVAIRQSYQKISHYFLYHSYSVLEFGMIVGIVIIAMGDNVEQPFGVLLWLLLYLMIGMNFQQDTIENGEEYNG